MHTSSVNESLLEKGDWEEIHTTTSSALAVHGRGAARWFIDILRPSFASKTTSRPKQTRRTAYLDGVRGFAAFLVYWHHHQLWARETISADGVFENSFGYNNQYYFACLPFVRTFFTGGHYAVTVFFVLSGYVLSTKPLSLMQSGDYNKLSENLSSALFRRWLRLHLPVIATTFIYMSSWHLLNIRAHPDPKSTYREELKAWYQEIKQFTFIFRQGGDPWFTYNFHVWSIPTEFKGSIVVYTALMAFARCTKKWRLACEVGLIVYFLYVVDGWFCALFMSGMLLCDLDLLAAKDELPRFFSIFEPFKKPLFYAMFILSVYLGGVPSHTADVSVLKQNYGWYYLSFLKPHAVYDYKWFFLFLASSFLVASVRHISPLKRFFETRFCQYLGRVSFALYLVHGPVIWTLADRFYSAVGWPREIHATNIPGWVNRFPISKAGPLGLELNFLAPHIILLPVTFWLAELVTKLFDEPSVRFAQWSYKLTQGSSERL